MTRFPLMVSGFLMLAALSAPALAAGPIDCELRFSMSGWSAFYKHATGSGTVTCDNGQSMKVSISAKGGGLRCGEIRQCARGDQGADLAGLEWQGPRLGSRCRLWQFHHQQALTRLPE